MNCREIGVDAVGFSTEQFEERTVKAVLLAATDKFEWSKQEGECEPGFWVGVRALIRAANHSVLRGDSRESERQVR